MKLGLERQSPEIGSREYFSHKRNKIFMRIVRVANCRTKLKVLEKANCYYDYYYYATMG